MTHKHLILRQNGPVAEIRLNNPGARNAISYGMMAELYPVLRAIAADASIRILVLRGEGMDFSPGANVKSYGAADATPAARGYSAVDDFNIPVLLHEMPAVTIAAVRGACAGAGLGWALACDVRIACETARFNVAFLDVGVAGDMGGPWTLPRIVGAAKARELYLFPGKFDAAEALRIGLVSKVSAPDDFEADLAALTDRLARSAPLALRALKQHFVAAEKMGFADYVALESEKHTRLFQSEDTTEAFKAFVEKRPPVFQGR
jgi:2-(1,2-epoxy-1,2-dihydrophenyl)acetyl-CoA isomerase